MLEIPESYYISKQLQNTLVGKVIKKASANTSPHGFAWYYKEPEKYNSLLAGKHIKASRAYAGQLELEADGMCILFCDGVNIRYFEKDSKLPVKHQLHLEFEDGSSLVCSIAMYGGLLAFPQGEYDNPYYLVAKEKPSPLEKDFNDAYFESLFSAGSFGKLSAKAFLATEQRIPGLGNGVLQDILFHAGIHPKRKIATLQDSDREILFHSIKSTLADMADKGGRDTEKDIFGNSGGYKTILSKNTVGKPCPVCGSIIKKESYLGGSIYICEGCQK